MRDRMRAVLICAVVLALGLVATAGANKLITGGEIKNGSISLADLSRGAKRALSGETGPKGPAGVAGAPGAQGAQGPAGPAGVNAIQRVSSPSVSLAPGYTSYEVELSGGPSLTASCPAGQVVVGTGFNNSVGYVGFVLSFGTFVGGFMYNDSSITINVSVQAMCAPGSATGVTAAAAADRSFERAAAREQGRVEP